MEESSFNLARNHRRENRKWALGTHAAGHVAVNPMATERKRCLMAAASSPAEHQLSSLPKREVCPVGKR